MIIERFVVGPVESNCYLFACPETREAAVIDPGGGVAEIASRAKALSLSVRWIFNTHGHADHIGANRKMKEAFPTAKLAIHEADAPYLDRPELNLSAAFGIPLTSPAADVLLHDADEVAVGALRFQVIHVPGHTPGGIALYAEAGEQDGNRTHPVLFCGDALFAGSIGRTDFAGGSHTQLLRAVRDRLLTLPPETTVYPGHGEKTTIEREAQSNPFLA